MGPLHLHEGSTAWRALLLLAYFYSVLSVVGYSCRVKALCQNLEANFRLTIHQGMSCVALGGRNKPLCCQAMDLTPISPEEQEGLRPENTPKLDLVH